MVLFLLIWSALALSRFFSDSSLGFLRISEQRDVRAGDMMECIKDKVDVNDIEAMNKYKISLARLLNKCIDGGDRQEYRRIIDLVSGNGKRTKIGKY